MGNPTLTEATPGAVSNRESARNAGSTRSDRRRINALKRASPERLTHIRTSQSAAPPVRIAGPAAAAARTHKQRLVRMPG